MTKAALQTNSERIERVHVEADVEDRAMQKHRGKEPPKLPLANQIVELGTQRGR